MGSPSLKSSHFSSQKWRDHIAFGLNPTYTGDIKHTLPSQYYYHHHNAVNLTNCKKNINREKSSSRFFIYFSSTSQFCTPTEMDPHQWQNFSLLCFEAIWRKTSFISKHSIPSWYFDWHDVRTKILQNIYKPVSTKYKNLVVVRIYKMSEASSSILLRYMSNNLRCMISHWSNEIFFAKISHKNKKNCP